MPVDQGLVEVTNRFTEIPLKILLPAFGVILLFVLLWSYISRKIKNENTPYYLTS